MKHKTTTNKLIFIFNLKGLKLLQKAKKNSLEIVSQQPRRHRLGRVRALRSISDEDDEEEVDEMEELRVRIK